MSLGLTPEFSKVLEFGSNKRMNHRRTCSEFALSSRSVTPVSAILYYQG